MPLEIETEIEHDLEDLKKDIETTRETDRWSDAPADVKELFHVLEWNIIGIRAERVLKLHLGNTISYQGKFKYELRFFGAWVYVVN